MTKITSFDLTPFYRNTVGIDSLFDRITRNIDTAANTGNYPPYDIVKTGEETYEIRVAAAGFRQDEIEVEIADGPCVSPATTEMKHVRRWNTCTMASPIAVSCALSSSVTMWKCGQP